MAEGLVAVDGLIAADGMVAADGLVTSSSSDSDLRYDTVFFGLLLALLLPWLPFDANAGEIKLLSLGWFAASQRCRRCIRQSRRRRRRHPPATDYGSVHVEVGEVAVIVVIVIIAPDVGPVRAGSGESGGTVHHVGIIVDESVPQVKGVGDQDPGGAEALCAAGLGLVVDEVKENALVSHGVCGGGSGPRSYLVVVDVGGRRNNQPLLFCDDALMFCSGGGV